MSVCKKHSTASVVEETMGSPQTTATPGKVPVEEAPIRESTPSRADFRPRMPPPRSVDSVTQPSAPVVRARSSSVAHLWIECPLDQTSSLNRLFSTHPPLKDRITALWKLEGGVGAPPAIVPAPGPRTAPAIVPHQA
jgi:hypothetical protein